MVCGLGKRDRAARHEVQLLLINQHASLHYNYIVERNKEKLGLNIIWYVVSVPKCVTDSCDFLQVLLTTVCLRFPIYKNTGNGLRLNIDEEHCIALRAAGKKWRVLPLLLLFHL